MSTTEVAHVMSQLKFLHDVNVYGVTVSGMSKIEDYVPTCSVKFAKIAFSFKHISSVDIVLLFISSVNDVAIFVDYTRQEVTGGRGWLLCSWKTDIL